MLGQQILKYIFRYRRLLPNAPPCEQENCLLCLTSHLQKIEFFIEQEKPLHFILPAFPAKSPNPQKVLSSLPDMGERVSLQFLQLMCNQIREIYAPGAKVTICSDGRVFSDLVAITDDSVTLYRDGIKQLLEEINADAIDLFNLENVFGGMSFDNMRTTLVEDYAQPVESIREQVNTEERHRQLFNGVYRLLLDDYLVLYPHKTRDQVQVECNARAYEVIQRSNAWTTSVAKQFPESLRLSIHPQPYHSEKIGIHMIKTLDPWGTPWHSAPLFDGKEFLLMKRSQIESMGATMVWHNGHPSHYVWKDFEQTSQSLVTVT